MQQSHYRVWMWDFTSWSLCLSVEGSLSPYLRFCTGKWVSVTSVMQYFLTGSWCLAIWKQACPNIACTFPTSTDLWGGTCARTSEMKMTDNRVLTLQVLNPARNISLCFDVSITWPPAQQLWNGREVRWPPHVRTARSRPRLANPHDCILPPTPACTASAQFFVEKRNSK